MSLFVASLFSEFASAGTLNYLPQDCKYVADDYIGFNLQNIPTAIEQGWDTYDQPYSYTEWGYFTAALYSLIEFNIALDQRTLKVITEYY